MSERHFMLWFSSAIPTFSRISENFSVGIDISWGKSITIVDKRAIKYFDAVQICQEEAAVMLFIGYWKVMEETFESHNWEQMFLSPLNC